MSVLEIRKAGDPVLKKIARPVTKITKPIKTLIENMAETMHAADGVGLAAPQVGISQRIVVVDVGGGLIELVNPEIIESAGCETAAEGCLSVPGMWGDVERFTSVTVKGLDRNGEPVTLHADRLLARALQHEIDHLDGVLFIERAQSVYRERKE